MTRSRKTAALAARWRTGSNGSQGVDQRGERVAGEPALPGPDPGQDRLAADGSARPVRRSENRFSGP